MTHEIVYRFKRQRTGMTHERVQAVGAALADLAASHDAALTAAEVVTAATDPVSPLHACFEWDDQTAASAYRLDQARWLLRNIEVKVVTVAPGEDAEPDRPARTIWLRQYHHVNVTPDATEDTPRYVSLDVVRQHAPLLEQVIAQAREELAQWRIRYQQYQALRPFQETFAPVLQALDTLPAVPAALPEIAGAAR